MTDTPIPPALLLDVNRLNVEVERLKKERDEWKEKCGAWVLRFETTFDAGIVATEQRDRALDDLDDALAEVARLRKRVDELEAS